MEGERFGGRDVVGDRSNGGETYQPDSRPQEEGRRRFSRIGAGEEGIARREGAKI